MYVVCLTNNVVNLLAVFILKGSQSSMQTLKILRKAIPKTIINGWNVTNADLAACGFVDVLV